LLAGTRWYAVPSCAR